MLASQPSLPSTPIVRVGAPPLWEHQREGVRRLDRMKGGYGLFLDMGCGKSRIVVEDCNLHNYARILILCPLSVVPAWVSQFNLYGTRSYYILPMKENWTAARKRTEAEHAEAIARARRLPLVLIINYESAWRPPLGQIYDATGERVIDPGYFLARDWDVVCADELHRCKDPQGRASRFLAKLGEQAHKRIGLTGTPMPHSPLDLFAQYRFLDPSIFGRSYYAFKARYAVMGGYENKEVVGYNHTDEMNARMYSIAYRVRAADVLDLPPAVHVERTCELEPKARKHYKELWRDFVTEVDGGTVTAANAMVKLLRLQQLTSGYLRTEEGEDVEVSKAKAGLLTEIFSDLDTVEPVVVFCRFRADLDTVRQMAEDTGRSVAELSGRSNQLADWQAGNRTVLAVQIQAGGVGIDLSRAHYAVYYSLGFSLGEYEQSLARLHRPGQARSVTYLHLIADGTVDRHVYAALRERKDVVTSILDAVRKGGTL
jgi:SNF2 family DNA or RNA helicase